MKVNHFYDYIAQQPCLACGARPVEVCHIRAIPSKKVSDLMPRRKGISEWAAIPLCPEHHRLGKDSIHAVGERNFAAVIGKPPAHIYMMLARYLAEFCEGL